MGRKKIEIRPLADERNRNVTFLKRKAGLMKKAWELSVLCGADVSILIFSSSGKPYEFSSQELDPEIDRYLDYEGVIERRRAPEFAAMALAGEEDDEDEEELPSRRGSSSRIPSGMNGSGTTAKSLKGKETFKARMTSRAELARAASEKKGKGREERGFIDGILDGSVSSGEGGSSGSEGETRSASPEAKPVFERKTSTHHARSSHRQRSDQAGPSTGATGHHYATTLHDRVLPSPSPHPSQQSTNGIYPPYPTPTNFPQLHQTHSQQYLPQLPYQQPYTFPPPNYNPSSFFAPTPQKQPLIPNNMQWDPNLLSRYAEYQLQQNHQRQQRALLERQRQQLAELGVPVEDKSLLDQLFSAGAMTAETPTSNPHAEQAFEWPSVNGGHREKQPEFRGYNDLGAMFTDQHEEGMVWPTAEEGMLPSPNSAGEVPRREKRDRERERERGESKRNRVF